MKKFTLCGGYGLGVPPVPIPNTEVKPQHADGTWLETARESRSLPHFIFLSSSMAERSAVNRNVVGSSPTWGAIKTAYLVSSMRSFCVMGDYCHNRYKKSDTRSVKLI